MAISEFYASTILKVSASFGFASFDGDPDEITKAFGFPPDEIRRKGERNLGRGGREFDTPFSSWAIISAEVSKDVNEHLRGLLRRIEGKQSACKIEFGRASFGVTWKCNYLYAGSGPFYEADVIAGIASWQAELFQDIYQVDQEQNDPVGPEAFRRIPKRWFAEPDATADGGRDSGSS